MSASARGGRGSRSKSHTIDPCRNDLSLKPKFARDLPMSRGGVKSLQNRVFPHLGLMDIRYSMLKAIFRTTRSPHGNRRQIASPRFATLSRHSASALCVIPSRDSLCRLGSGNSLAG